MHMYVEMLLNTTRLYIAYAIVAIYSNLNTPSEHTTQQHTYGAV